MPVNFANNTATGVAAGTYALADVPAGIVHLSAKTDWSLRRRLPVNLDGNGQGVDDFAGANKLHGGDLNSNNIVNFGDYNVLTLHYLQFAPVADINGDGIVNFADYNIMRLYFFTTGDAQ